MPQRKPVNRSDYISPHEKRVANATFDLPPRVESQLVLKQSGYFETAAKDMPSEGQLTTTEKVTC